MERKMTRKDRIVELLSSVGLIFVGSLLIVYGANMGYDVSGGLAYVFYFTAAFGALTAAAGVLGFRRLGDSED